MAHDLITQKRVTKTGEEGTEIPAPVWEHSNLTTLHSAFLQKPFHDHLSFITRDADEEIGLEARGFQCAEETACLLRIMQMEMKGRTDVWIPLCHLPTFNF